MASGAFCSCQRLCNRGRVAATGAVVGSTMVRRQLGRKLRRLREDAGKTHADVESARIASATKMWRIETGKTAVKPGDVWALARLYDAPSDVADVLADLASGTRGEGWWEDYGTAVPDWLGLYAGLEAASSSIRTYHPELVHGLLQTPAYAEAVIRAAPDLTAPVVRQRLRFRLERQRAVLGRAAVPDAVLGAGALALRVGSDAVMDEQIAHLRALDSAGRVRVRILPWTAGAHPSMKGAFTILDFDDPEDPSLVYLETHVGGQYFEQPRHLTEYHRMFDRLRRSAIPLEDYTP
jgi:transcriptional regulator with XRE-family HTH domain